jgi:hypothetical protein
MFIPHQKMCTKEYDFRERSENAPQNKMKRKCTFSLVYLVSFSSFRQTRTRIHLCTFPIRFRIEFFLGNRTKRIWVTFTRKMRSTVFISQLHACNCYNAFYIYFRRFVPSCTEFTSSHICSSQLDESWVIFENFSKMIVQQPKPESS